MARSLDAEDFDRGIVEEGMKQAHRIGAAADAGNKRIGNPASAPFLLPARSVAITQLEIATILGKGIRPRDSPVAMEVVGDFGAPAAQGLVHPAFRVRAPDCT